MFEEKNILVVRLGEDGPSVVSLFGFKLAQAEEVVELNEGELGAETANDFFDVVAGKILARNQEVC